MRVEKKKENRMAAELPIDMDTIVQVRRIYECEDRIKQL